MDAEQLHFSEHKPESCPACGSVRVAEIMYGFPGPGMIEDAATGDTVLGGCCVSDFDPEWRCLDCEISIYPERLKGQLPPWSDAF